MRIVDLLLKNAIVLDMKATTKEEVLNELATKLDLVGKLKDKAGYVEALKTREAQSSTGIGEGVGIPHAKSAAVKDAGLALGISRAGLDYDSLDGETTQLFFMIAAPEGANNVHLDALSRLSTILMDPAFRKSIMEAKDEDEILALIDIKEQEKFGGNEKVNKENGKAIKVVAVTACPTGIAHTFMAAEKLESVAAEKGIDIKVEKNAQAGIKNGLTKQDIEEADFVIVAADKQVAMGRFNGKKLLQVPVADGIKKANELLEKAIKGDAPVYKSSQQDTSTSGGEEKVSAYKALMNGVSHMLPLVVAGGILIAISFMFGIHSADPSHETYSRFAEIINTIGGTAFGLMLPILAGYIAFSIADRPGLVAGLVGGALAGDVTGSGFLGAIAAGFLAGYVVKLLVKVLSGLPDALEGIKPILLYPILGVFITGFIMIVGIGPVAAALNDGLMHFLNGMGGSSKVVLGLILGGMMAVDMGGPVNKTAYVFGTMSLAEGNPEVMAAVMAGGMTPPLAIAFATTFFKNKFTDEERKSGITNYIMGASFITEGAIPFAAADPKRVIPSIIAGSALAGALSMVFGCASPAPHGGLFVIGLIANPLMYIVAVLAGAALGAAILGAIKPAVK